MRIIAGEHRGRRLVAPDDNRTRPTTDRVREALFSSIASIRPDFEEAVIFDAFSGSGALALEAMSRGASFALMQDSDQKAINCIRKNIRDLGYSENESKAIRTDSFASVPSAQILPDEHRFFDLVFLDPPYACTATSVVEILQKMSDSNLLKRGALAIYEHDAKTNSETDAALENVNFRLLKRKCYGRVAVDVLEYLS